MGSGGGSTTFGKGKSSSSSKVRIPSYLRPLVQAGIDISVPALGNLQGLLSPSADTVADFNPIQQLAHGMGVDRALGGGGYIPTAQNTFLDAAQGTDLSQYISPDALATLGDPTAERDYSSSGYGQSTLEDLIASGGIPDSARQALEDTVGGKYLYGGEGFDQAVQAAVRAAQPAILSTFGGAGAGGGTGALAHHAIGRSAGDAVASQYGQERGRQDAAAQALGQLGLAERGQTGDLASALASLGFAETGLRQADDAMDLEGAGLLSMLGQNERGIQMDAASMLPDIGLADVGLLSSIGGDIQDQEQRELLGPINNQLQLLQAAMGGVPIESLLGQKTNNKSRSFTQSFWGQGGM